MSKPHFKITDKLTNIMSNLNTLNDTRSYNEFTYDANEYIFQNPHQLYAAYRSSWLARKIVNVPVKDALREWRTLSCEDAEEIQREEKRLRVQSKFTSLGANARLAGGAIMVMITGQPFEKPLDINKVKKGDLKGLQVFDRFELSGSQQNITNPLEFNFLMPEYYLVNGSGVSQIIHHSHCVIMQGNDLPRYLRQQNQGWGDSILRQCMEDLKDIIASKGGLAALLQKANVDILKSDGIKQAQTTDQEMAVAKRMTMFKLGMSNHNLGVLDITEDLMRIGAQFGGTSDALNQLMIWLSGCADIPMTRLFGIQSTGLSDTGGGDQKNYFDSLRSEQSDKYSYALETLDQVLVRSALGTFPDDYDYTWNPLYQETGLEKAQQRLAEVQSDNIDLEMGVATVSQIQRKRQATDTFFYSEEDIDKLAEYEQEQFNYRIGKDDEEPLVDA